MVSDLPLKESAPTSLKGDERPQGNPQLLKLIDIQSYKHAHEADDWLQEPKSAPLSHIFSQSVRPVSRLISGGAQRCGNAGLGPTFNSSNFGTKPTVETVVLRGAIFSPRGELLS